MITVPELGGLWAHHPIRHPPIRTWCWFDPDDHFGGYLAAGHEPELLAATKDLVGCTYATDLPGSRRYEAESRLERKIEAKGLEIEFTAADGRLHVTNVTMTGDAGCSAAESLW